MSKPVRPPLAHPIALAALVTLLLNDHVLKSVAPGPVTGKLSDVAGLVLASLLLAAVARAVLGRAGRPVGAFGLVLAAAVVTGLAFTLVKTTPGGALAWSWGLGTLQWLIGGAWLRGEAPLPVAVVRDASDLLALPALALAVLVVRRPVQRAEDATGLPSRLVGPILAIIAGVACLATSQSAPTANASATRGIRLDADRPSVAYRVTWSVDADLTNGSLTATVENDATVVTILPEDGVGGDCVAGEATHADLNLGSGCADATAGSATVLVQLLAPDDQAGSIETLLQVGAYAFTQTEAAASAATMTVAIEGEPVFQGRPVERHDEADGRLTVSAARPDAIARLVLVVDPDALREPLTWPLVGRVSASQRVTGGSGAADQPWVALAIGDGEDPVDVFGHSELDWLALCRPGKACRIPVTLTATHDPMRADDAPDPSSAANPATIEWVIDVRLQAFDGRTLPAGAVRLEKP